MYVTVARLRGFLVASRIGAPGYGMDQFTDLHLHLGSGAAPNMHVQRVLAEDQDDSGASSAEFKKVRCLVR